MFGRSAGGRSRSLAMYDASLYRLSELTGPTMTICATSAASKAKQTTSTYLDFTALRVLVLLYRHLDLDLVKHGDHNVMPRWAGDRDRVILRVKCMRILGEGDQTLDSEPAADVSVCPGRP
jgi:hypothetical protein